MNDISPGQEVYIGGASGGPATVVYHGTLPGMERDASDAFFLRTQRALLEERAAWADDGDIVDGLIRAIGGQS